MFGNTKNGTLGYVRECRFIVMLYVLLLRITSPVLQGCTAYRP